MRRFLLPELSGLSPGDSAELSEPEARHAVRVLRLGEGDALELLDGCGVTARGAVSRVEGKRVGVVVEEVFRAPAPLVEVSVFQALIKGKAMDFAVQKLSEMGVRRIVPIRTRHSEVRLSSAEARSKCEKWRQSASETLKQCGYPWRTQIEDVTTLGEAGAHWVSQFHAHFVSDLRPHCVRLRLGGATRWETVDPPLKFGLWTGPEGDWSVQELEALGALGAHSVHLGPSVLRSETASVVATAQLFHEASRIFERPSANPE